MSYRQLNAEERSALCALRMQGFNLAEIGRYLGRHRSTIGRELKRNAAPYDGGYRVERAHERAVARRRRSRRKLQFQPLELERVERLLREEWSPEQVAGYLRRSGVLRISHETIYRHVWRDWKAGGTLHRHLRGARKQCRKRDAQYDSRGRLAGKRMIGERPATVETRGRVGHWEIDTVMGESLGLSRDCLLTLVERKTGFVLIGKLAARTVAARATPSHPIVFQQTQRWSGATGLVTIAGNLRRLLRLLHRTVVALSRGVRCLALTCSKFCHEVHWPVAFAKGNYLQKSVINGLK